MTSADKCRKNKWAVGDCLVGDEGHGPTVIQITAIGEENILAKCISHNGQAADCRESNWTLEFRDWKKINNSAIMPDRTSGDK